MLRSFVVLAQELHFGRAAARLGIGQSALSQQLQRLEASVGAQLVQRSSRTVQLTTAGVVFRADAQRLLEDADRATRRAAVAAEGRLGTVTIGSMGATTLSLLPAVVARLRTSAPELRVLTRQLPSDQQLEGLRAGTLDAGLTREFDPGDDLHGETLSDEPVRAVLPVGHRLAGRESVRLIDLRDEPFVLWQRVGASRFHDRLMAACERAGFTPAVEHELVGSPARQAFVAAGLGVALEAASYEQAAHRGVRFVPLHADGLSARIQLAWRIGPPDPARDALLDAARAAAGDQRF